MSASLCYERLANRVRTAREVRKLSQAAIASKLGVAQSTIARIENGKQRIPLHLIGELARALGLPPDTLTRGLWS